MMNDRRTESDRVDNMESERIFVEIVAIFKLEIVEKKSLWFVDFESDCSEWNQGEQVVKFFRIF